MKTSMAKIKAAKSKIEKLLSGFSKLSAEMQKILDQLSTARARSVELISELKDDILHEENSQAALDREVLSIEKVKKNVDALFVK